MVMGRRKGTPMTITYRFNDGGLVAHKVTLDNSSRLYSVWFDRDGILLDAEGRRFINNPMMPVRQGGPTWRGLQDQYATLNGLALAAGC